jgi:hypothetical protein
MTSQEHKEILNNLVIIGVKLNGLKTVLTDEQTKKYDDYMEGERNRILAQLRTTHSPEELAAIEQALV